MTEAEWVNGCNSITMLESLRQFASIRNLTIYEVASGRKLTLFACACCRSIWPLLADKRSQHAVVFSEQFADSDDANLSYEYMVEGTEFNAIVEAAFDAAADPNPLSDSAPRDALVDAASAAIGTLPGDSRFWFESTQETARLAGRAKERGGGNAADENLRQSFLLRDILGNPFRPVTVDPAWLTSTVVSLAQGIYEDRAFDRLPILADALEDAGCTQVDMLNHCRQPGEHVRGCWPVDLLLGKE
jgi:hypothetical protein